METEENIVYQLLEEINGGKINNDEPIGERTVRSLMRAERPNIIRSAFKDGLTAEGPEFQSLGIKSLTLDLNGFSVEIPPIIQLPNYSGIKLTTATGNVIPIMSRSSYMMQLGNITVSHMPKAYLLGQKLFIHEGVKGDSYMGAGAQLSTFVDEIAVDKQVFIEAILFNPDDGLDYEWTTSPYPLSAQLLSSLKGQIKNRSFATILQTSEDEVANMKSDNVRYHDQGKVD